MKKCLFIICVILSFSLLFIGCTEDEVQHTHEWQPVSGEHSRICTVCEEKELIPEACKFISTDCTQPSECEICHATNDDYFDSHDFKQTSVTGGCTYTNIHFSCTRCGIEQITHADSILPSHDWSTNEEDGYTVFSCQRCRVRYNVKNGISEFSYAQTLEEHKIGDPGVQHENFDFSYEGEIKTAINAILRADRLLTVEYDMISVSFDSNSGVWCVEFSKQDLVGGSQSIYFDKDGSTCYIIYGE